MAKHRILIRNFKAVNYMEDFLIAAVATVLGIRLFLEIAGYPKIGGGGLHIAHMLWGGLLMLASIIMFLSFLSRTSNRMAAILGGIGFGTFIDEVGKFVTSDNNYFFQPTVALIYVTFILIFLIIRTIHARQYYSDEEYLMNALEELEEVALHDLDEEEKDRALDLLEKSDPNDPLVTVLKNLLSRTDLVPLPGPGFSTRIRLRIRDLYYKITRFRWFQLAVMLFFLIQMITILIYAIVLVFFIGLGWEQILDVHILGHTAERMQTLSFIDWAQLASSLLSGIFIFWGILQIRRSRLSAFRMFERSILVSIFLTQVFTFYKEEFSGLLGLFFNILVLIALRYMIEREELVNENR